jgi:hypothetical protein
MKKYQFIISLFWIGLSLFVMFFSYKLGLKDKTSGDNFFSPGPGLMPFLIAIPLLIISLYITISEFLKKNVHRKPPIIKEDRKKTTYKILILVLICLFIYPFFLESLGYLLTTSLVLFLLFKGMGIKWGMAIFVSTIVTIITYLVFTNLGLLFPEGIIKLRGVIF